MEVSTAEYRNVQWELENLREEKSTNEKNLNEMMFSIQQDYEKQIDLLQTQITDLQKQRSYHVFYLFLVHYFFCWQTKQVPAH